jgi:type III pantothenate kinase
MQGLITIDFGNSHPHAGLFQKTDHQWQLIKTVAWKELPILLNQLDFNPSNSSLVLSEVKSREDELLPLIEKGFLLTRVKSYWKGSKFAGMPVHYGPTLGEDRLIEAFYLYKKDKIPTLMIDAGTYVTMDVVTAAGFMGGFILPSQENYFETFKKGELLKNSTLAAVPGSALPQDTTMAMAQGYSAFVALAKSLLIEHGIQKIIVTGGNGSWWLKELQTGTSGIHVKEEKDLIHLALHFWMTTQIETL